MNSPPDDSERRRPVDDGASAPDRRARRARSSPPSPRPSPSRRRCSSCATPLPEVVDTRGRHRRGRAPPRRRHRPDRHRRRARLGLPLLRSAPTSSRSGARAPAPRWSTRSASTTSSPLARALDGPEWILHAASQDLPCLAEIGLRPTRAVRHRAGRTAARLPPRRAGHPGRGGARAPAAQGALRGRLVDAPAARPRGWSTPRSTSSRSSSCARRCTPSSWRPASGSGPSRSSPTSCPCRRPRRGPSRGDVPPGCTRPAAAARWPRSARCGTPATRSPPSATSPRAGSSPTPRSSRRPPPVPATARRCSACAASTAAAPSATPRSGSQALRDARELPDTELPAASARYDGPPPPRAWGEKNPAAAARLTQARAALAELAEELSVPVENLLTPDSARRVLWQPPAAGPRRGRRRRCARWARGRGRSRSPADC